MESKIRENNNAKMITIKYQNSNQNHNSFPINLNHTSMRPESKVLNQYIGQPIQMRIMPRH